MSAPCKNCGFQNEYGYCECSGYDKWYACPIENKKPENIEELQKYAEFLSKYEGEWISRKENE